MRESHSPNLDSGDAASMPPRSPDLGPSPWPPPPGGMFVVDGGRATGGTEEASSDEPGPDAASPQSRPSWIEEVAADAAPPQAAPQTQGTPGVARPTADPAEVPPATSGQPPAAADVGSSPTQGGMEFVDEKDLKPRECAFSLALPDSDGDERRVAGRFPVDQVRCDQGRILDLSRTGLRLERLGRLPSGRAAPVMISDGETVVAVMCEIRWERKLGFMKWSYGLKFHGLSEADMRSIARIAANCREQRKLA